MPNANAFTPLSAKNAKVRYTPPVSISDPTPTEYFFTSKKWVVTPKVDALEITNFESGGFADWIGGITECDGTVDFDWDSANDEFANPPNITPGAIGGILKLYTNDTTSPFWYFPSILIVETPQTSEVRGVITGTMTFKSKGTFSLP